MQKQAPHGFGLPMNLFWGYIAIAIFMQARYGPGVLFLIVSLVNTLSRS